MKIQINNTPHEFEEKANLIDVIGFLQLPEKGIALAIDNRVIPKAEWSSVELFENMKLTMIRATQGG
jgi:sulfur carrier protein